MEASSQLSGYGGSSKSNPPLRFTSGTTTFRVDGEGTLIHAGSTTLGDAEADLIDWNGVLQGGTPLRFEGFNVNDDEMVSERRLAFVHADMPQQHYLTHSLLPIPTVLGYQ